MSYRSRSPDGYLLHLFLHAIIICTSCAYLRGFFCEDIHTSFCLLLPGVHTPTLHNEEHPTDTNHIRE